MTTIGLIGSGNIGSTVARLAVDAGYDVVLSNSRGPETLADLVADLGEHARAATASEAAQAADLAVVTVPLKAVSDLPAEALAGTVVIDTNNYYPERDGQVAELDDASTTTSEIVQRELAGARIVKGFNNIYFKALAALARPTGAADRTTLPLYADDDAALADAIAFLDAIGYDALAAGPLAESWRSERDRPVYVHPYATDGDPEQPASADRDQIAALLADPGARQLG